MVKKTIKRLLLKTKMGSMFIAQRSLLHKSGYLKQIGWLESYVSGMPCDKSKQALPWYSYSAIAFLEKLVDKGMFVFEYGSGNSTLWWSNRVCKVVSCEHSKEWYQLMKPMVPTNVEYLHIDLVHGGDYSKELLKYKNYFDIVVIDGRDRVNCARNSLLALKNNGVIVWDNSDREKYAEGYDYLTSDGFKRLDFIGLGPVCTYGWCTSIFYRKDNCLGI